MPLKGIKGEKRHKTVDITDNSNEPKAWMKENNMTLAFWIYSYI
jgi:hypothetical protein